MTLDARERIKHLGIIEARSGVDDAALVSVMGPEIRMEGAGFAEPNARIDAPVSGR